METIAMSTEPEVVSPLVTMPFGSWKHSKDRAVATEARRSSRMRHRVAWTQLVWLFLLWALQRASCVTYALDSIETVRSSVLEAEDSHILDDDDDDTDQPKLWGSGGTVGSTGESHKEDDTEALVAESDTKEDVPELEPSVPVLTAPLVDLVDLDGVLDGRPDAMGDNEMAPPTRPLVVFQGSFQKSVETVLNDGDATVDEPAEPKSPVDRDPRGGQERNDSIRHESLDPPSKGESSGSSGSSGSSSSSSSSSTLSGSKRLWGADHHAPVKSDETDKDANPQKSGHIPFVKTKPFPTQSHERRHPPEGFTLAARVYIDSHDNLAHFDVDETNHCDIALPYFDCGAMGSTTAALPVKDVYFRHLLSSSPTVWRDAHLRPVLAVALTPLRVELDSGEAHDFDAGDVILLEDSMQPGHQIMATTKTYVSILFVTLPKPHHHVGQQHLSLQKVIAKSTAPCRNVVPPATETNSTDQSPVDSNSDRPMVPSRRSPNTIVAPLWNARRLRLLAMGTVSLSLSTLMADFLAKTAPLWLAVGVGGTCFVVGATYGLVVAGDAAVDAWDVWRQQQRLDPTKRRHDTPS